MSRENEAGARPRKRRPRWMWLAWIAAGLVAVLILGAVVIVAFVQSAAFEEQLRARVLPEISKELGREVSFESVDTTVFPVLGARVQKLRVAGRGQRDLFQGDAAIRIALWPLISSGGKRVEVRGIELRDPELNLVRTEGGRYDFPRRERKGPSRIIDVPSATIENGTLRLIDPARGGEVVIEDIEGRAKIRGGVMEIESLEGEGFEGTIRLDGSKIDFRKATPRWDLELDVRGLEMEALPSRPMEGTFRSSASLEGVGLESGAIQRSLSGTVEVELRDGDWERLNLEAAILAAVVRDLQAVGLLANPPERLPEGTELGDVRQELTVEDGWMILDRPLEVRTSFGEADISGRIAVDQRLDLEAATSLPPSLIAELTGGKLELGEPVPIVVQIGGTLARPNVTKVDTQQLAPLLLREGIRRLPDVIPDIPIPTPKF